MSVHIRVIPSAQHVNAVSPRTQLRSLQPLLAFWGIGFFLVQQAERLFLLPQAMAIERPTASLLAKTLAAGGFADLVTALAALAVAMLIAAILGLPVALAFRRKEFHSFLPAYRLGLQVALVFMAVFLLAVSTADICYYGYNHQHLDFVFFEYVDELVQSSHEDGPSQAAEQTDAELEDSSKWVVRIGGFLALQALVMSIWRVVFLRAVSPFLVQWQARRPYFMTAVFAATVSSGAAGLTPYGQSLAHVIEIESDTYYSLSQNPLLFARQPLHDAVLSQWTWTPATLPVVMSQDEAIRTMQDAFGRESSADPSSQYPLIREYRGDNRRLFHRPVNILLIFVEGLDRRYLNQVATMADSPGGGGTGRAIRLTPFLDRLKDDSVYFEHFFSNGVQTTRGIFATLCSTFPRQGTAVIKTHRDRDYLCAPSLLQQAGYRTEMVVSLDSDLPGLRPFLARNGVDRMYSERDVPADAERLGIGLTDGALFDFLGARLENLQAGKQSFFLSAMTAGTHHPFTVPLRHPDVRALQSVVDGYPAALRYFDLEFERFFTRVRESGLLKDTMVLVLGDHGRHEPIGRSDVEREAGHFLAPLFIWIDPSLRTAETYRPHIVDQVASQVDVVPTILAVNGIMPRRSPFMGQDLSCLFIGECLHENRAYLSSVYDDLVGLADRSGLWLYSFRRRSMTQADLAVTRSRQPSFNESDAAWHYRQMIAFYLATNRLIEENRVWNKQGAQTR